MKAKYILGLIVNLVIPGLGTIMVEKYDIGVIQLCLTIAFGLILFSNIPLVIISITSIPILIIWIWALITSIRAFRESL
jgi:hypothetical protein